MVDKITSCCGEKEEEEREGGKPKRCAGTKQSYKHEKLPSSGNYEVMEEEEQQCGG